MINIYALYLREIFDEPSNKIVYSYIKYLNVKKVYLEAELKMSKGGIFRGPRRLKVLKSKILNGLKKKFS